MKFLSTALALLALSFTARAGDGGAVLAELNLARTQPQAYARIVAARAVPGQEGQRAIEEAMRFLEKATPLAPLTASSGLAQSALAHVVEQGPEGTIGHGSFARRISRFGQWSDCAGEAIDYGAHDARSTVVRLIVDDGVRDRAHRGNIFQRGFRVAGVAVGAHARYGSMCVIDFAGGYISRADGLAAR